MVRPSEFIIICGTLRLFVLIRNDGQKGQEHRQEEGGETARQEAKEAEKLKRGLPARLDALLVKAQEETKDIDLFADPPPKEECPICLHPHFFESALPGFATCQVHSCCGKKICRGCIHASDLATDKINKRRKKNKEPLLPYTCSFCRDPRDSEKDFKRYQKRMKINDGEASIALAGMYSNGDGTQKNETKALDLYCLAAELGVAIAYSFIAKFYNEGIAVEESESKRNAFDEIAAKKGHMTARHNLGAVEHNAGNFVLAIRHYKIAAEAGYQQSLDYLNQYAQAENALFGNIEVANISKKCLASQAKMKTDQRDARAKYSKELVSKIRNNMR